MRHPTRIALTREGWYYLAVLGFVLTGAALRQINLLMVVAGMLCGPLLVNLLSVIRSLRAIDVARRAPHDITADQPLTVEIALRRPKKAGRFLLFRPRLNRAVLVEDPVRRAVPPVAPPDAAAAVLFAAVASGQEQRLNYQGRLRRRGVYELGPLRISTRWPFGLIKKTVTVDSKHHLVVYPKPGRLTPRWRQIMGQVDAGTRFARGRLGRQEGDFYGLRAWREGDSRRWIHWRSSARRGALLVRQFEQQIGQDLILMLDAWLPDAPRQKHRDAVERAVSFAGTLVADVCSHGSSHLVLASLGVGVARLEGNASGLLLGDLLEHLARIEPGTGTDLRELIRAALDGQTRGRNVLLVSTRAADRDQLRLAAQPRDPGVVAAIDRCLCVSARDGQLDEFFQFDDAPRPRPRLRLARDRETA